MSDIDSQARAIFFEALDRESPEQLRAYVDEACGDDEQLRARVDDLLRASQDAGDFLGGSASAVGTLDHAITEHAGADIDRYKLLEQIGEGGFGVVFMAEQTEPVRRKVALKIIKAGMDTKEVIARFEAERQALAMMDHPNIARVLDAGATVSGRPYFVMELVRGIPITEYCDQNKLTALTAQVWDAATGRRVGVPMSHRSGVTQAQFSPDSRHVVTASWDRTARVWEASTGRPITLPLKHGGDVMCAAFSPDGHRIVTASTDLLVRVSDLANLKGISRSIRHSELGHDVEKFSATFSPDGRCVLTASADQTARVWDASTREPITPLLKHEGAIRHATFSADSHLVLTTSDDGTASIWDAATGQPSGAPLKHDAGVVHGTFSPDGGRVVTASDDGTARLWDLRTAKPILTFQHSGSVHTVQNSPGADDNASHAPGPPLLETFQQVATQYVPDLRSITAQVAGNGECFPDTRRSDHRSFWDEGYPALLLGDTGEFRSPHYHRPSDTIATLDLSFAQHVTQATLATALVSAQDVNLNVGDFDGDGILDADDIDLLSAEIKAQDPRSGFDLNSDGLITNDDRDAWVHRLKNAYFGDSNLDGEFNSGDLIAVFQAGKYEVDLDAGWIEGDWTGDRRFDSSDLIAAFQDGGYELGTRTAVNAVPEPTSILMLMVGLFGIGVHPRRTRR